MIIGLGETVYDIIFKENQPQRGVPGGSAYNAMISIGRSGAEAMMVTEVGDDHIGDIVTQFLKDNGVDTSYVYRHEGTKSHISLAFLDENNDAHYQFYKDHASLCLPNVIPSIKPGDIVLFGSYFAINPAIRDYVCSFLTTAREKGATLYYDINFRASHKDDIPYVMDNIEENMKLTSILRGSSEDFEILLGAKTGDEAYERIRDYCDTLIYTDAANPVQVFTPKGKQTFPVPEIETVSTIGAGDNFNAGFCYALYNLNGNVNGNNIHNIMPRLVASGLRFSAEVCQSMENYIAKSNFFC